MELIDSLSSQWLFRFFIAIVVINNYYFFWYVLLGSMESIHDFHPLLFVIIGVIPDVGRWYLFDDTSREPPQYQQDDDYYLNADKRQVFSLIVDLVGNLSWVCLQIILLIVILDHPRKKILMKF